jgi:hypothetical protein
VVFAAAVLELGVAVVLWRHWTARWAPGLVLWLVAFFGAYRLGLWNVRFLGYCACLGYLLASWPGCNGADSCQYCKCNGKNAWITGVKDSRCLGFWRWYVPVVEVRVSTVRY